MVASYKAGYQRHGEAMSDRDIERQVIADCELVDAAKRHGDITSGKPAKAPAPASVRPDPIAEAERLNRKTLTKSNGTTKRGPLGVMDRTPQAISERWGYATARIARITEGAGRASTLTEAVDGAELPKLARKYAELWAHFMTRGGLPPARGVDHNPFRHLNDGDASRMFIRKVEDICDESTGSLGSWFVK